MAKKLIDIVMVIVIIIIFIFGVAGIIDSSKTINNMKDNSSEVQSQKEQVTNNSTDGINNNQNNVAEANNGINTNSDVTNNSSIENGNQVANTQSEEAGIKTAISTNLQQYHVSFEQAVNTGNFSVLAPYLYPDSPIYNEQESFIPKTYNDGIQEQFVSSQINGYQFEDNNKTVKVMVTEVFDITYSSGTTQRKAYNWTYTFKYSSNQGSYLVYSIN